MGFKSFYKSLARKKPIVVGETKLSRFLNKLDLTILGVGTTLGVGVYVISGDVSKNYTGPGIILSFAIAAFASLLAGLCYAEFGARVPKAGSAYVYSFVTIGEFVAFIIGWNLILEYAIGSASVAKGISNYIDAIADKKISAFLTAYVPIHVNFLGGYVDFLAFGIIMVVTFGLAFGTKESSKVNSIIAMLNMTVVLVVIVCGILNADFSNWQLPPSKIPEGYGTGGFLPYGFIGVIKGAGMCFYAFIGFDVIATAGEETQNPKSSIPFSICASLLIVFLSYFGISAVLTLMLPYYEQDIQAPLPSAFHRMGWISIQYIVTFGALFGMFSSLYGSCYPLPRITYAMAEDGLLFEIFGKIHPKYRVPFYGTLFSGLLKGILAMIFDLNQLVSMISIGTIMAYSIVAASVLLLRYEVDDSESDELILNGYEDVDANLFSKVFNNMKLEEPTKFSSNLVTFLVTVYVILCAWMSIIIMQMGDKILENDALSIILLVVPVIGIILTMVIITRQPKSSKELTFKAPFNPWLPALSIMINIYLIVGLGRSSWIRFGVWIAIGLVIYFGYSRPHQRRFVQERVDTN